ncbi:hypothetical protein [Glaciecola sp. SC05]|uniref:IS66 family insertion sequence element accessory protein TnpA n=1 Tax=Glaciecola sp. SC05 TaxID=1987355 RepID=UPI003527F47D
MKSKARTKAQWLLIFDEQQNSGLSIKAFCERHSINLQTFRARKSDWSPRGKKPGRALVKIETPKTKRAAISCQFKGIELACNDSVNPQWFADMIKALAQ